MFIIQRKNLNKVRYWKDIIKEHKSWEKIYYPLEAVDNFLIKLFPFFEISDMECGNDFKELIF